VKSLPRFLVLTGGAFVAGVVLLGVVLGVLGYDPGAAFRALISGSLGSWHALSSSTLVRATPLILLGLGFSLAWRAGGLNIGMEGQFLAGAIVATWIGLTAGFLDLDLGLMVLKKRMTDDAFYRLGDHFRSSGVGRVRLDDHRAPGGERARGVVPEDPEAEREVARPEDRDRAQRHEHAPQVGTRRHHGARGRLSGQRT